MKNLKLNRLIYVLLILGHFFSVSMSYAQFNVGGNSKKNQKKSSFQVEGSDTIKQLVVLKSGYEKIGTTSTDMNSNTSKISLGLLKYNTSTLSTLGQELTANQIFSCTETKSDELAIATNVNYLISQFLSSAGIPIVVLKGGVVVTQTLFSNYWQSNTSRVDFDVKFCDETTNFNNTSKLFTIQSNGLYRGTEGSLFTINSGNSSLVYIHQIDDFLGISETRLLYSPCFKSNSTTTEAQYKNNQTIGFELFTSGADMEVEMSNALMIFKRFV